MKKSILTIALAVLALAGAGTQASAQTPTAKAQAPADVQAVDLGLPSGIRWASCNVGATTPEGYGNYYAWGETTTKADYSWATYKHANGAYNKLTKYCYDASYGDNGFTDDKTTLDPEDDAATANWGEEWRMPTDAEWTELRKQCTWTWTTQNGVNGYQVTSKTNSNYIFLPATGQRNSTDINYAGSIGNYWYSSLISRIPNCAWYLDFSSGNHDRHYSHRYFGLSVRPVREATAGPANVQATQGDTTGVTVTWDAVPDAVSYEITAEAWDVAINRTVRTKTTNETHLRDTIPVRPALGRYTVKAVFADGTKSKASESAIGYAVLETMRLRGISTRWPWNGKVDIDIEYKTVRPRFQELFGMPNLPYHDNVTLTARTADGKLLPMRTLEKEPAVDKNYTVNRRTVQNGEQPEAISNKIFSGSGWLRIVWNADADTLGINAPGTTITLTASDDYAHITDSATVDVNTTKPEFIFLTEKDTVVSFPWAARWADEASRSLNMQDGTDIQIRVITRYGTDTTLVFDEKQLSDEGGICRWKTNDAFGVIPVVVLDSNRATAEKTVYKSKFFRYVTKNPVTVEPLSGNKLNIWWTGSGDCTYYQVIRREVNRDGTRSAWGNMAPVSTYDTDMWGYPAGTGRYIDIGIVGGKTYEYAVLPIYYDPDTHDAITAPLTDSTFWSAGRVPVDITLDAQPVEQSSIALTWTDISDAYSYDIYRDNGNGQYQKITNVPYTATTFTDTRVEPGKRYTYKAVAFNYKGDTLETSDPVDAYAQLDALYLYNLQPRFPWNGLVDIFVGYRSAREVQTDGTPHFQVVAVSGNDTLAVKTLTLASAQTLDPNDFTLPADGTPQRLVWDARTDLGANNYPKGLVLTVSCARVEPYQEAATTKAFEGGYANGGFVPLDLRRTPEVQLGSPTTIYTDLGWFEGATRLEVFVNGTSVFSTTDENNDSFTVGKEQLTIWGTNTLKLKSDNGIEQTAQIKYPDFVFTATQGNRDSIIVVWNSLDDVRAYSIRRRAANTADAFVEVALVSDTTRWADTSEETFIGEFEYTIMPLLANNEEAGPQPAAVIGYRAQDIARPVTVMPTEHGTVTADKPTARYGETVTLTITPAEGYAFDQLTVKDGETDIPVSTPAEGTCTFTMPAADVVVSATFKAINYTVTTASAENGTLTADKQTAHYGDIVTLTITPATGYELDQLTVKDGETDIPVSTPAEGTYTFTMPANNVTVSATFYKKAEYSISITLAGNGSVIASKATTYEGDTVEMIVTPAVGYELEELRVLENGKTDVDVVHIAENDYTFIMPAGDVVISAKFVKIKTAVDAVNAPSDVASRKILRDGQVLILRNGKTYTLTGAEVK